MLNRHTKILVTSRSGSGSWAIRGEQLGAAIGATVERNASKVKGFDLAIVVKRPKSDLLHRLQSTRVPIVWDVVDAWPQPEGNNWGRENCLAWLREEVKTIKPVGIVAATRAMEADCVDSAFGVPVLWLPHHARPNQRINPIRERVQTVGYEGAERYLGHWLPLLQTECTRRGWRFVLNPPALADLDIVVAFRHIHGYAAKHWKSNVKLANAQGSGTPCVLNSEAGYQETATGSAECWAETPEALSAAFDSLLDRDERMARSKALLTAAPQLPNLAERYRAWLGQLKY